MEAVIEHAVYQATGAAVRDTQKAKMTFGESNYPRHGRMFTPQLQRSPDAAAAIHADFVSGLPRDEAARVSSLQEAFKAAALIMEAEEEAPGGGERQLREVPEPWRGVLRRMLTALAETGAADRRAALSAGAELLLQAGWAVDPVAQGPWCALAAGFQCQMAASRGFEVAKEGELLRDPTAADMWVVAVGRGREGDWAGQREG
jgi:hypothetical protein